MRIRERVGHAAHDATYVVHRCLWLAGQARTEWFALYQGHHEADQTVPLFDRVDGNDVRVIELGRRLRFAQKALLDIVAIGQLGRQHLDGDGTPQLAVGRLIHDAHAAPAEFSLDRVRVA